MTELFRQDPRGLAQLLGQLENQVKSYHRHYGMGVNSSVSAEIAQELLASMVYTAQQSPLGTLEAGREVLKNRLAQAKERFRLVRATSPDWESQYRWETVGALGRYLEQYDLLHFAHRVPGNLDYPLLTAPPDGLLGLDYCLYCLNCLWLENRLLHTMGDGARGTWEQKVPDYWGIPLNLCEQPLIQLLGRQLLGLPLTSSDLTNTNRQALATLTGDITKEALRLQTARLCHELDLFDPAAVNYACSVADSLYPRLTAALPTGDLSHIFI